MTPHLKQQPDQQETIASCMNALKGAKQQEAVFRFMLDHPNCYTHIIAREAGCINVPDCVANIQSKIHRYGVTIQHYLPEERCINRHGRVMAVHRWYVMLSSKKVAA
jgi:hypothetical protein